MLSNKVIDQYARTNGITFMEAKYQLWLEEMNTLARDFSPGGKVRFKGALKIVASLYDFHFNEKNEGGKKHD